MNVNHFSELNSQELASLFGGEDTPTTTTDGSGNDHCDTKDDSGCVTIIACPEELSAY